MFSIKSVLLLIILALLLVFLSGAPAQRGPVIVTAQDEDSGMITLAVLPPVEADEFPPKIIQPTPAKVILPERRRVTMPTTHTTLPSPQRIEPQRNQVSLPTISVGVHGETVEIVGITLDDLAQAEQIAQPDLYARLAVLPDGVFYGGTWPEVERRKLMELARLGKANPEQVTRLEAVWANPRSSH